MIMTHLPAAGRREPRELSPGSWKDNSGKTIGREGRALPSWGIESPGTETGKATYEPHEGNEKPTDVAGPGDGCEGDRQGSNCPPRTELFQGPELVLELHVNSSR